MVADLLDVEMHRARDVADEVFGLSVTVLRRQIPGGVEHGEIGRLQPVVQPVRRDEVLRHRVLRGERARA